MPMERKLNQMSRLKLYMVAIDNQKKKKDQGEKIIQVWTKPQNP